MVSDERLWQQWSKPSLSSEWMDARPAPLIFTPRTDEEISVAAQTAVYPWLIIAPWSRSTNNCWLSNVIIHLLLPIKPCIGSSYIFNPIALQLPPKKIYQTCISQVFDTTQAEETLCSSRQTKWIKQIIIAALLWLRFVSLWVHSPSHHTHSLCLNQCVSHF